MEVTVEEEDGSSYFEDDNLDSSAASSGGSVDGWSTAIASEGRIAAVGA